MEVSMKRRWHNIFRRDNRSFILAMDHGIIMDVCGSLVKPSDVINKAKKGGIDAILTSYGIAQTYQEDIINIGLILRIDGGTTHMHPVGHVFGKSVETFSVLDAVRIGADGVMCMGFTGLEEENLMFERIARIASDCNEYGIVFGAEMIPGGFQDPSKNTIENIAFTARLGAEYGADFIKTTYLGNAGTYKEKVIEPCFKPVVILGGGAGKSDFEILSMVREAMSAGCQGVAIGRNIWTHSNIENLCKAISMIIHEDISVEEAIKIIS